MSERSVTVIGGNIHVRVEKHVKPAISYGCAVESGIIIVPNYAQEAPSKIEETSPVFGSSDMRNVPGRARKRSHEALMPDQTGIEWRRYQKARVERLARELDAAVRAYSEADSESVLKEDLASEKDERPERRCIFIDDEAEEDNECIEEQDEFIVLDEEDNIIVIE